MANYPIPPDAEVRLVMRKIETSDPVHADVMNPLFQQLIENDAAMEELVGKRIEKTMVSHVLDTENVEMVMGADVGPQIVALVSGLIEYGADIVDEEG